MTGPAWLRSGQARLPIALLVLALSGCAAQLAHKDGLALVAQGRTEEGLSKLALASNGEPSNAMYRQAYFQARDRAVVASLGVAEQSRLAGKPSEEAQAYRNVLVLDPRNDRARAGLIAQERARRHATLFMAAAKAWQSGDRNAATTGVRSILLENPGHSAALALQQVMDTALRHPAPDTAVSAAYRQAISIEFTATPLRLIFDSISRKSGLNFVFDKEVKSDSQTTVSMKNRTVESVVNHLLRHDQLEQQILDDNTVLIYPGTAAKRKEYQELMIRVFYIANADAKALATTLKSIAKLRDVVVDEKLNLLVVRDTADAIGIAEKLIALQDIAEPEVILDIDILEVKRGQLRELGVQWPDTVSLSPLSKGSTVAELGRLNGSSVGVSGINATAFVGATGLDTNVLANPRIRVRNREKAKVQIGEKLPSVSTTVSSGAAGQASQSVSYLDVGLTLNVEPTIYLNNEVAIKFALEVSNLIGQTTTKSGSVGYQLGTRQANTLMRLKDGETQVVAGLIKNEERGSARALPILGDIPIVRRLFGATVDDAQETEVLFSITPHIVRGVSRPAVGLLEFVSGTEAKVQVKSAASTITEPIATLPTRASGNVTLRASETTDANANPATSTDTGPDDPARKPDNIQLQWSGPTQLKVGETVSLHLALQSDQALVSLSMVVGYDKRALQFINASEGDFLKQGGAASSFTSAVSADGTVQMAGIRAGDGGATARGDVAVLNFRAVAAADQGHVQLLFIAPTSLAGQTVSPKLPPPFLVQVVP